MQVLFSFSWSKQNASFDTQHTQNLEMKKNVTCKPNNVPFSEVCSYLAHQEINLLKRYTRKSFRDLKTTFYKLSNFILLVNYKKKSCYVLVNQLILTPFYLNIQLNYQSILQSELNALMRKEATKDKPEVRQTHLCMTYDAIAIKIENLGSPRFCLVWDVPNIFLASMLDKTFQTVCHLERKAKNSLSSLRWNTCRSCQVQLL